MESKAVETFYGQYLDLAHQIYRRHRDTHPLVDCDNSKMVLQGFGLHTRYVGMQCMGRGLRKICDCELSLLRRLSNLLGRERAFLHP